MREVWWIQIGYMQLLNAWSRLLPTIVSKTYSGHHSTLSKRENYARDRLLGWTWCHFEFQSLLGPFGHALTMKNKLIRQFLVIEVLKIWLLTTLLLTGWLTRSGGLVWMGDKLKTDYAKIWQMNSMPVAKLQHEHRCYTSWFNFTLPWVRPILALCAVWTLFPSPRRTQERSVYQKERIGCKCWRETHRARSSLDPRCYR